MPSNDKARIAIVGTGWWSTYTHIPHLAEHPNAELVALADRRPDALKKAADSVGRVKSYTDYNEMLASEELDGVIVSTNHTTHYEVAKAALDAGKHVLMEKPMVMHAREAHELTKLAKSKGLTLIVGYPWNYTESSHRARDIIQSGELGVIQYVSSLFTSMTKEFLSGNDQAYTEVFAGYPVTGPGMAYADPKLSGGGQGHLQVTHSAGSLFFITDLQPDLVSSFMQNWGLKVDITNAISARFKPVGTEPAVGIFGSTGNIGTTGGGELNINVYCEHGYIMLDNLTGTLIVKRFADQGEERFGPLPAGDTYPRFATSDNLVDVILGRGENISPAEPAVRVVELLEAAYRSAANDGQVVKVSDL